MTLVCNMKIYVYICVIELCCDINMDSPFVVMHAACIVSARSSSGASHIYEAILFHTHKTSKYFH
jgi:hypothetical protein